MTPPEPHWEYIEAAFALSVVALGALTLWIYLNLKRWASRAKAEDKS